MDPSTCKHDFFRPFPRERPLLKECKKCRMEEDGAAISTVRKTLPAKRDEKGRLLPGEVLNPKGVSKPPTFARLLREATNGGRSVSEFLLRVLSGAEEGTTVSHKLEATRIILDRMEGKAVERVVTADLTGAPEVLATLSTEQLETLARLRPGTGAKPGVAQISAQSSSVQLEKSSLANNVPDGSSIQDAEFVEEDS
jgi:hypothetical protein